MSAAPDVIVIGAGIVGAACARALQAAGMSVAIVDASEPGAGATGAGMGHLVALDETADELDLCLLSLGLWRDFFAEHPNVGEPHHCGTLWVAEDERQLAHAHARAERLTGRGWDAVAVNPAKLAQIEPALRRGLCGGVHVRADSVVYPPTVARALVDQVVERGGVFHTRRRVAAIEAGSVLLHDGARLRARHVVLAAGAAAAALLPGLPVFPRKGHLAVSDRYPGTLSHQVVSMGYGQSAAGADALAVAANVQPRPTGQWLIGSCRQDGVHDSAVDPAVLAKVLQSAIALLPCLGRMRIIRAWTGMRPATPDGRPLIGPHPSRPGLWLAAGHEGLGVTTAFGTAHLLAAQMTGRASAIAPSPYAPSRFAAMHGGRDGQ
ncbi:NAD(P)/FAD-dependent oxidoreductase [Massilia glaciei]|uniref:FAD-binding oxidoreductase n=1 Tax=Massilia glaciei TaxID=1524097 RepID=A0A2U2HG06_9BURK|nr:FAD-binding oxidoreductase [Massilia glaciei]PWF43402.1 FAD-binding oxidoreductase [Massilia glaciei]